ncbi:MAG: histidine kinase [Pseudomonadota bacterium]
MSTRTVPATPPSLAPIFGWRRLAVALISMLLLVVFLRNGWTSGQVSLLIRAMIVVLCATATFGVLERWPRVLPSWLPRWVLQLGGVALAVPLTTLAIYLLSTDPGAPPFWQVHDRLMGFGMLIVFGMLLAPWVAFGALVHQRDAAARHQALAFELERSELERRVLDARLHLLQAQIAPHFLFNTLANVQALVDAGSPRASAVLRTLSAYLRAAVPRIHEPASTLGQELQLVEAYLQLMHMRMPDRLQFALHVDDAARSLLCPPMTLLTLVENAVHHGIDPSEEGGRIDIRAQRRGARCILSVTDTGAGLRHADTAAGAGLATLRERLQLSFGGDAQLRLAAQSPRGVSAEIEFPAKEAPT